MPDLKFEKYGINKQGDAIYRLVINGRTVRDELTIDQVIETINSQDEERLGWEHSPKSKEADGYDPV